MPVDVLVFALLIGPYQLVPHESVLTALALLFFLVYIVLTKLGLRSDQPEPRVQLAKQAVVMLVIAIMALSPTLLAIVWRHNTEPYKYVHDGLLQSEIAVRYVLTGKNPYAENYFNTPMEQWPLTEEGVTVNPALYHYIYMPLTFILPLPFQALAEATWGWFDQRLIYLVFFVGLLLLSSALVADPSRRLAMQLVLGLNPLFTLFFIQGRNDVLTLFWLLLVVYLLRRGHVDWSAIVLALACGTKQTAFFFVPFYLAYVSGTGPIARRIFRLRRPLFLFAIGFLVIVLPWVVWNPSAFFADTLAYQSGMTGTSYPIAGFGFSRILLVFGAVRSNTAPFPFWVFQVGLGLPLLGLLLRRQEANPTLSALVANPALLLFIVQFFSRAFNDNYLGMVVSMLAAALLMDQIKRPDVGASEAGF